MTVKRATRATAFATLTTPCTLQDLRNWLHDLDVLTAGAEKDAAVATTTSQISIS